MIKAATTRLNGRAGAIGVIVSGGLIFSYVVTAIGVYSPPEFNPLNWSARDQEEKHLSESVFDLSDTNRDGRLSWLEVGEMYRRAGFDIDSGRLSGKGGIALRPLKREGLEKVIDSYR